MKSILIACAGALAFGGVAFAQDITTGNLAALDTNSDGSVDATEFDTFMVTAFTRLDANGDGYITVVEAEGVIPADVWAAANSNGDDGLSKDEFVAMAKQDFANADKDSDGKLD